MRVHLTSAGTITMRDAADFRRLDVLVDPQPCERLEQAIARIGRREGEDHVRLAAPVLRFLSGKAGDPEWESGFARMVEYAAKAGWVDAEGGIRAHITRNDADEVVSLDEFKAAMRALPAGISVITTGTGNTRAGMIVSSLTSISADPPLVGVFVNQGSSMHAVLLQNGSFVANVLGVEHGAVMSSFLGLPQGPTRFANGNWREGGGGLPVLDDALASLECEIVHTTSLGTHDMFVGKIRRTASRDASPVVHFNASTHCLSALAAS
ncbi:flavin reductase family protein [Verticiella sediminum]|uniref:Flavin reductase family protein n=1 Tax=Verticiella sediminum TaxID=1247510 RepID=A0A556AIR6_9BURK|nr:flavin reductase family protein [Verticiella sediminum]TSH92783.1 flavin reductase family protein [Verticiella sediminum]